MIEPANLVSRIYEAAVIPEQWSGVLAATAQFAGAKDAVLIAARDTSFVRWLVSSPDFGEVVLAHSQLYPANLRTSRLLGAQHAGFLSERDVLTQDEIDREPIFQEFLIPRGYGSGVATAIVSPSGDNIIVHAEFGHTDGPRPGVLTRLDQLRPHFARAALLSSQLGLERARAMTEALGMLGLPGAVLRGAGKLYAANAAFEALMPGLIRDHRERVHLANDDADRLLAAALARVSLPSSLVAAVNSIPVAAGEGGLPYIVHLVPIRGAANDVFTQATALLIVTPVDRAAVQTAEVLQGLFDLTPAEARVARGIAEAKTIDDVALVQGVTRETVRSQLKAVLAKTGLNRQSELVSLLAGASPIRP